jgi:hypothetical protein
MNFEAITLQTLKPNLISNEKITLLTLLFCIGALSVLAITAGWAYRSTAAPKAVLQVPTAF